VSPLRVLGRITLRITRWPTSTVDPASYTTRRDVNCSRQPGLLIQRFGAHARDNALPTEARFKDEERFLLGQSRKKGHKMATDLEFVSDVRHYGLASRLIACRCRKLGLGRRPGRSPDRDVRGEDLVVRLVYELLCRIVELLVLRGRTDRSKDVAILVLRKQLEVLRHQVPRPRLEDRDRVVLAALSKTIDRRRWRALFVVTPATLLRWHRCLVARH
jgi:hypothetical protein